MGLNRRVTPSLAQLALVGRSQQPQDLASLLRQFQLMPDGPTVPVAERVEAASLLAESTDIQAVQALLRSLTQETEARVFIHVMGLLARKRIYSAVEPLISILLGQGESAIEAQTPDFRFGDTGTRIRISIIQALGRMGDDRAIDPLMALLGEQRENYRIRLAAAESLGRLGDNKAFNPLMEIIQDENESSQYLKESAVKALGMLGDIRALDPLLDMFEQRKGLLNKFSFLKEQIVEAIGRLGGTHRRAQQALIDALDDPAASIRLSAVESLSEVGEHEHIPYLLKRLQDSDDDVAIAAISALFQIGGERLIREILETGDNLPQFIREELETYVP